MSLSLMLESPHSVDLRPQMADWLKLLQDLGEMNIYQNDVKKNNNKKKHSLLNFLYLYLETLLDLFKRYQQMWIFLTKYFKHHFGAQRMDLVSLLVSLYASTS